MSRSISKMNVEDFTAEAQKLVRVSYCLRRQGHGEPLAYWHGIHDGPCISFANDGRWLTVVLNNDGRGIVRFSSTPVKSSVPLYGELHSSLPPVDAVFLLGSDQIYKFLLENDWPRNEPFNRNFPAEAPHEYERLWQHNCPIYRDDLCAVVGGWNMPWPDGDFEDLISSELLVWTFEDAEPWIEVFRTGDEMRVCKRIT